MTREEAIDHIKDVICENNTIKPNMVVFEQEKEALCIAIKALKQEPCEDAVSREAVLNVIEREHFKGDAISEIERLPSVAPARAKGKWCEQNDDYFDWYECSECAYGSEGEMERNREYDVRTNFCPNCGADMRGGE